MTFVPLPQHFPSFITSLRAHKCKRLTVWISPCTFLKSSNYGVRYFLFFMYQVNISRNKKEQGRKYLQSVTPNSCQTGLSWKWMSIISLFSLKEAFRRNSEAHRWGRMPQNTFLLLLFCFIFVVVIVLLFDFTQPWQLQFLGLLFVLILFSLNWIVSLHTCMNFL